ncbi:MAG: nitroreductase family deazaflavin-dependent oxidoreductase [Solirubrobacterales bacterium]
MASDLQWKVFNRFVDVHTAIYRATRGRVGAKMPRAKGRMLLLDQVGRKSGKKRTQPLLYVEDGEDLVIVASKGGSHKHPAWFLNLMANPETTVQVGSEKRSVIAREANDKERKRLWPRVVEAWSDYESYQQRTERQIPLVILSPRG